MKAAVDAASAAGGGHVIVPANGTFLAGSFSLASDVFLILEDGAVLLASNQLEDYPEADWDWDPAFIDTRNVSNSGILGPGRLDGQALPLWVDHYDSSRGWVPRTWEGVYGCVGECRPKLVRFVDCDGVTMQGVTLANSPDWNSLYRRCNNVRIDRVTIQGDHQWPNNDGIDIESGENITITDVDIDVADDGICISSGSTNELRTPWEPVPAAPVANLHVKAATIRSKSSAIKFSAIHFGQLADHGDIHSCSFRDISIRNSSRGIGFQQRTGSGSMFDLTFDQISIETTYPSGTNWSVSPDPCFLSQISFSVFFL